jgi:hypothetical protein
MQLRTLLGMQAEDMLHLHSYEFDVLLEICVIIVSIGSSFIIYFSILGLIQKYKSMLNLYLIELVV